MATAGPRNLLEVLHESGHAIHEVAVRTRPAFLDWTMADTGFVEGIADVLGWDADEPAWQRHWLGDAAEPREAVLSRYGWVMLDICWALFEIELHRRPDRRPNDVWTEITAEGLGVVPHPEWSWWAIRGQLIDLPGYMANYALSAIMAAAVRARILERRGPWFDRRSGLVRVPVRGAPVGRGRRARRPTCSGRSWAGRSPSSRCWPTSIEAGDGRPRQTGISTRASTATARKSRLR